MQLCSGAQKWQSVRSLKKTVSYAAARQKTVNAAKNAVFTKIAVVEKTMNKVVEGKAVAGRTQGDDPIEKFLRIARAYVAEGITEFDSAFIEAEQALLETRAADYGRGYAEGKLAERAALRESASPKREVRELCDIHRASVSGCHECQKVDGESAREVRSELVDNSLILKALATLQVISPVGSTDYEAAKSLLAKVSSLRSASPEAPAAKGQ